MYASDAITQTNCLALVITSSRVNRQQSVPVPLSQSSAVSPTCKLSSANGDTTSFPPMNATGVAPISRSNDNFESTDNVGVGDIAQFMESERLPVCRVHSKRYGGYGWKPSRPGAARLRHLRTGVCKLTCLRREPRDSSQMISWHALAREGLVLFSLAPSFLCVVAFVGMVAESVRRGSLPQAYAPGQLCVFIMLIGMSLPLVQANHDLVVEALDSKEPTASRWQAEDSSSPLRRSSARPHLGTRVDGADEVADLCAVARDAVATARDAVAEGYLIVNPAIYQHCDLGDVEPDQVEAQTVPTTQSSAVVAVGDASSTTAKLGDAVLSSRTDTAGDAFHAHSIDDASSSKIAGHNLSIQHDVWCKRHHRSALPTPQLHLRHPTHLGLLDLGLPDLGRQPGRPGDGGAAGRRVVRGGLRGRGGGGVQRRGADQRGHHRHSSMTGLAGSGKWAGCWRGTEGVRHSS